MVDALLARGDTVFVIDDASTGSRTNLAHHMGHRRLHLDVAPVQSSTRLRAWSEAADAIIHLAAAVGVRRVMEGHIQAIQTNLHTTEAVLEAAAPRRTPVFVASSSEVYGAADTVPFREEQALQVGSPTVGRWSYACSKALCEFLAQAYALERGVPVVIGRLFNTTGPRQTGAYGMVLPTFVAQALRGDPITVYGDGQQTRCFADVRQVVDAVLQLMASPDAQGEIFNIGSHVEITIQGLAERIRALTQSTSPLVQVPYEVAYRPGFEDMRRRVPDLAKLCRTIAYNPQHDLDAIIQAVINDQRHPARGPVT